MQNLLEDSEIIIAFSFIYFIIVVIAYFYGRISALSIILSRIFLGEKLRWQQYIFVSLIMVGVVILSLG